MHPTAPLFRSIRRLALNTKQAGKDYYKGNRTGSMGSHTKYGGYIVDPKKVRTYVCPDLSDFNVSEKKKRHNTQKRRSLRRARGLES
jgi:large subunit ribosomal protein L41